MHILSHLKTANGWQRIWIICSTILFLILVLPFEGHSTSIAITELRIAEFENETCTNILKAIEINKNSRYDVLADYSKQYKDNDICGWTIAGIKSGYGPKNRSEAIDELDRLKKSHIIGFISMVSLWVFLCGVLYGIGLIGRWVRRGGFRVKNNQ